MTDRIRNDYYERKEASIETRIADFFHDAKEHVHGMIFISNELADNLVAMSWNRCYSYALKNNRIHWLGIELELDDLIELFSKKISRLGID